MKKLMFDTSAVNSLAADADALPRVRSIGFASHIGRTESVLAEVVAHPAEDSRKALLDLLGSLL